MQNLHLLEYLTETFSVKCIIINAWRSRWNWLGWDLFSGSQWLEYQWCSKTSVFDCVKDCQVNEGFAWWSESTIIIYYSARSRWTKYKKYNNINCPIILFNTFTYTTQKHTHLNIYTEVWQDCCHKHTLINIILIKGNLWHWLQF